MIYELSSPDFFLQNSPLHFLIGSDRNSSHDIRTHTNRNSTDLLVLLLLHYHFQFREVFSRTTAADHFVVMKTASVGRWVPINLLPPRSFRLLYNHSQVAQSWTGCFLKQRVLLQSFRTQLPFSCGVSFIRRQIIGLPRVGFNFLMLRKLNLISVRFHFEFTSHSYFHNLTDLI